MQLGSMFICNCNNCCTCFGRFLRPSSGALKNCRSSLWFACWMVDGIHTKSYCVYTIWLSVDTIDLGRLVGYLKPSHVTHQRLLLQFLSAPEDGRKKRPKHVQQLLQLQMNILPSCITLVLSYILTYDARKPKHKIKVRHLFISWTRSVQSMSSPPITLQSILFASSHLRL